MSEIFSLEDILGPPKSSIRLNYEFNFIGKNTHLIGTKSTSYPPIHDNLVEKEIVKEEEGDWLGWGLNLVIGIAVTAACAVVAVAAAPVTVTVAVVAGCAAVGSAIAVSDYHNGKPHPRAWWEAAGGILFGAGIGAVVGAELCYFPSVIAGTAEVAGIQASSMLTSVAVPKLATGLGYGLLGMNAIFGLDQASGVGDGETLLRRQNPELYDNLAMLSMILTEGYSSVGAAQQAMKGKSSGDNEDGSKADLENKLDYQFGKAGGNKHNIDRTNGLKAEMNKLGFDNMPENRAYFEQYYNDVLNNSSNLVGKPQTASYIENGVTYHYTVTTRESFLMGKYGGAKVTTHWDGDRLLTIKIGSGKQTRYHH